MELIRLTEDNLATEHICCAISDERDCQVAAKKAWLQTCFADGLVFLKGNVRGKCFIEYVPAERAWAPVVAPGYLYIDCLWVSGQYKGKGYSTQLLDACVEDGVRQNKLGLIALSSIKKRPFLADPNYLRYKGFSLCDTAEPDYQLWKLDFGASSGSPRFRERVKSPAIADRGFVLYYAHQCPFTAKYVPLLAAAADAAGAEFRAVRFETARQAQDAPAPRISFSLFYDGRLVTDEILSVAKFEKLLADPNRATPHFKPR